MASGEAAPLPRAPARPRDGAGPERRLPWRSAGEAQGALEDLLRPPQLPGGTCG